MSCEIQQQSGHNDLRNIRMTRMCKSCFFCFERKKRSRYGTWLISDGFVHHMSRKVALQVEIQICCKDFQHFIECDLRIETT